MENKINLVGLISFLDQVEPMFADDYDVRLAIHDCLYCLSELFFSRVCDGRPVLDDKTEK